MTLQDKAQEKEESRARARAEVEALTRGIADLQIEGPSVQKQFDRLLAAGETEFVEKQHDTAVEITKKEFGTLLKEIPTEVADSLVKELKKKQETAQKKQENLQEKPQNEEEKEGANQQKGIQKKGNIKLTLQVSARDLAEAFWPGYAAVAKLKAKKSREEFEKEKKQQ
jgi:hypothetical protein